jgi:hypothetical protein
MAWRSLFAFSNPTGKIGSQYTGTFNQGAVGTITTDSVSAINLYTFSSLPIGVYSIDVNYKLIPQGSTEVDFVYIYTGIATSAVSTILYPVNYNIPVPIATNVNPSYVLQPLMNSKFIVSVTNSNPIYINTIIYYSDVITAVNIAQPNDPQNTAYFYCIATKLA